MPEEEFTADDIHRLHEFGTSLQGISSAMRDFHVPLASIQEELRKLAGSTRGLDGGIPGGAILKYEATTSLWLKAKTLTRISRMELLLDDETD